MRRWVFIYILFMIMGMPYVYGAAGDLDPTFGNHGKTTLNLGFLGGNDDVFNDVVVQSDGKIVAVGSTEVGGNRDFLVARFSSHGVLDSSFGSHGIIKVDYEGNSDEAKSVALQSDGKIVVAGDTVSSAGSRLMMTRYTSDGTRDTQFGTEGFFVLLYNGHFLESSRVIIQSDGRIVFGANDLFEKNIIIGALTSLGERDTGFGNAGITVVTIPGVSRDIYKVRDLTILPDGKIVMVGFASLGSNSEAIVARLNASGIMDETFDMDGVATMDYSPQRDEPSSLALGPDGTIYVGVNTFPASAPQNGILLKYSSQGARDMSFGDAGIAVLSAPSAIRNITDITVDSDGGIIVAGDARESSSTAGDIFLAKYTGAGQIENRFGSRGILVSDFQSGSHDTAGRIILESNGRILVSAKSHLTGISHGDAIVAAYTRAGAQDEGFAERGIYRLDVGAASVDFGQNIAIQSDNKALVVAFSNAGGRGNDVFLLRYTESGLLDETFGSHGIVKMNIQTDDLASDIKIQADGKIVIAGTAFVDRSYDIFVARYLTTGQLDMSFGMNGIRTTDVNDMNLNDGAASLALQADGKIIVAGGTHTGVNNDLLVLRYTSQGALDPSFGINGIARLAVETSSHEFANAVAIQADGKIIAAGYVNGGSSNDMLLYRLTPEGQPDTTFHSNGVVRTSVGMTSNEIINAIVLGADGSLFVAGECDRNGNRDFMVAKYDGHGSLDANFGIEGMVITRVSEFGLGLTTPNTADLANDLIIQGDGKLLAVGSAAGGGIGYNVALVRYDPTGGLEEAFGDHGITLVDVSRYNDTATGVVLQSNGKIVLAGYSHIQNNEDIVVSRFESEGQRVVASGGTGGGGMETGGTGGRVETGGSGGNLESGGSGGLGGAGAGGAELGVSGASGSGPAGNIEGLEPAHGCQLILPINSMMTADPELF